MYFFEDDISDNGKFDKNGDLTGENVRVFDEALFLEKFVQIQKYAEDVRESAGGEFSQFSGNVSVVNPLWHRSFELDQLSHSKLFLV